MPPLQCKKSRRERIEDDGQCPAVGDSSINNCRFLDRVCSTLGLELDIRSQGHAPRLARLWIYIYFCAIVEEHVSNNANIDN